jgi:hypothetical protein
LVFLCFILSSCLGGITSGGAHDAMGEIGRGTSERGAIYINLILIVYPVDNGYIALIHVASIMFRESYQMCDRAEMRCMWWLVIYVTASSRGVQKRKQERLSGMQTCHMPRGNPNPKLPSSFFLLLTDILENDQVEQRYGYRDNIGRK